MALGDYSRPISIENDSDTGVLVIHGFTGTTSSIRPLAQAFGAAGFNVEAPCLSGHGATWRDLNRYSYRDWINDVEESRAVLARRCARVFAAGLSMGGALALHLAANHPDLAGAILVNHAIFVKSDWRLFFLPVLRFLIPSVEAISNDVKDPDVKEVAYDRTPLQALYQLMKLLERVRLDLSRVRQPVLILKSRDDHIVPVLSATYTYDHIASDRKELVWLDNSYHVATLDFDRERICSAAVEFVQSVTGGADR